MNQLAKYVRHMPECLHLQGITGGYDEHELPACTCGLSQALESQDAGMTDEPVAWMMEREDPLAPSLFTKWEVMQRIELRRNNEEDFTPLYTHPPQEKPATGAGALSAEAGGLGGGKHGTK